MGVNGGGLPNLVVNDLNVEKRRRVEKRFTVYAICFGYASYLWGPGCYLGDLNFITVDLLPGVDVSSMLKCSNAIKDEWVAGKLG